MRAGSDLSVDMVFKPILQGKFERVRDKDGVELKDKVFCTICKKEFSYKHSTSSLKYHLMNKHSFTEASLKAKEGDEEDAPPKKVKKQATLDDAIVSRRVMSNAHRAVITSEIAKWVASAGRPIGIVEDEGLQTLLQTATGDSGYRTPSRATITSRIKDIFETSKATVEKSLSNAENVAITLDYWTSVATESYLGVTGHFVCESDWKLTSHALGVFSTKERHTAENVAEHINTLIGEWEIRGKVSAVVTDNARNMIAAVNRLPYAHLPCSAHTLQLGVNTALASAGVEATLSRVRKVVGHYKHSVPATNALKAAQVSTQTPQHKLVSEGTLNHVSF